MERTTSAKVEAEPEVDDGREVLVKEAPQQAHGSRGVATRTASPIPPRSVPGKAQVSAKPDIDFCRKIRENAHALVCGKPEGRPAARVALTQAPGGAAKNVSHSSGKLRGAHSRSKQ